MDKQKIIAQQNNITAVKQVREKVENVDFSDGNAVGTNNRVFFYRDFIEDTQSVEIYFELPPESVGNDAECIVIGSNGANYRFKITYGWRAYLQFVGNYNYHISSGENRIYHIVLSYKKSSDILSIYINGNLKKEVQGSQPAAPGTKWGYGFYYYISNKNIEYQFGGKIFYSRIFNYALSQSEVTKLYNNGKPEEYVLQNGYKSLNRFNYTANWNASTDNWITPYGFSNLRTINGVLQADTTIQLNNAQIASLKFNPLKFDLNGEIKLQMTNKSDVALIIRQICFLNNGIAGVTMQPNESVEIYIPYDSSKVSNIYYKQGCYLYIDATNLPIGTTISISDLSITSVGCIAEYLPQNLLTSHDGQITDTIATKWLDSSKQLPLNDEYLPPLLNSIGGYDLTANGNPQIVYKSNNNQVVSKQDAIVGDLVAFDKYESQTKIVRGYTVNKDELDPLYTPVGVIYKVDTDNNTLDIVSLDDIPNTRWAASYEVMLSGFDLTNGGTFILTIGGTNFTFTYTSGTISDISTQINSTLTSNGLNATAKGGWVASVFNNSIILTSNTYSEQWATISVVSGITITYTADNKNYQTTLTGLLIDSNIEYVQRNNGVNFYFAGCNLAKFLQNYSANGTTPTSNIPIGSVTIVNQTSFENSDFCIDLRAVYSNYANYLYGEHLLKYPPTYGAGLRDGKTNTSKIGTLTFTDIRGNISPCYPAAYIALNYGVSVSGITTGFEKNNWWLPSVEEIFELMEKRAYSSATLSEDAVNTTLVRMTKATCYSSEYYPCTSCECSSNYAFIFSGGNGRVGFSSKYGAFSVRPVIKIKIND